MGKGRGRCDLWDCLTSVRFDNCIKNTVTCWCIGICLILSGPALLISGIVLIVQPAARPGLIAQYNAGVQSWTNTYAIQMTNSTFYSGIDGSGLTQMVKNVVAGGEPLADKPKGPGEHFDSYTAYYFTLNQPVLGLNWPSSAITYDTQGLASGQSTGVLNKFPNFILSFTTVRNLGNNSRTECTTKGGEYVGMNNCRFYYYANETCFKVSLNSENMWVPDNRYGGYGCAPNQALIQNALPTAWYPVRYQLASAWSPPTSTNIKVTVRSSQDPWILAQYLTDGTLNFGLTQQERATIGIVLVSIGSVLMLPCCCLVFCLLRPVCKNVSFSTQRSYKPMAQPMPATMPPVVIVDTPPPSYQTPNYASPDGYAPVVPTAPPSYNPNYGYAPQNPGYVPVVRPDYAIPPPQYNASAPPYGTSPYT